VLTRQTILDRLNAERAAGKSLLAAGASAGIIAKCADLSGADLIVVYSTGRSRIMGLPTFRLGDSNAVTVEMAPEILNVVSEDTPVIGGIEATDPTRRNLPKLLDSFVDAGYTGIINFPTVAMWEDVRRLNEKKGYGFELECKLIEECRRREIFTMAYVFNAEDCRAIIDAGADVIVAHSGPTEGGLVGPSYDESMEHALEYLEGLFTVARTARPDILCFGHGGPLVGIDEVQRMYAETSADGFVGSSSIERIPVERAVMETVRSFKSLVPSQSQETGK
jgi:predicted TIM-barrel enzyme